MPDEDVPLVKYYFEELQYHVCTRYDLESESNDWMAEDWKMFAHLTMETDYLPTPHGSALFTRGETQSLTTVTLGTPLDELLVESAAKSDYSKFILHYNFPPFSTGEVKNERCWTEEK